jgi:TetR/AcrR family transcriptional repressor of nem operon
MKVWRHTFHVEQEIYFENKTDWFIFNTSMGKAAQTRQFIIEKAAPLFNKKGVAGTSLSDIMEVTSLAKGGLYGNFDTKEEISIASFDYIADTVKAHYASITQKEVTAREKLYALLEYFKVYPLTPIVEGGCPILNFGVEADDTNPVLKERVSKLIDYMEEAIVRMVTLGITNGEFEKSWNARRFAVKMFSMLEGAILIARVKNNNKQMLVVVDILKEEIQAHLL